MQLFCTNNTETQFVLSSERDFSPTEIEKDIENNYQAISLGNSRLKTKTASIVAVHTINIK